MPSHLRCRAIRKSHAQAPHLRQTPREAVKALPIPRYALAMILFVEALISQLRASTAITETFSLSLLQISLPREQDAHVLHAGRQSRNHLPFARGCKSCATAHAPDPAEGCRPRRLLKLGHLPFSDIASRDKHGKHIGISLNQGLGLGAF